MCLHKHTYMYTDVGKEENSQEWSLLLYHEVLIIELRSSGLVSGAFPYKAILQDRSLYWAGEFHDEESRSLWSHS